INEIDFTNGINVFPNPVSDVLNISFELNSAQDAVVELVSIDGRIVSSVSSNNTTVVNEAINTSKLSTGMYILNVTTDEGKFTKNIMVK
ncbi:MAG: T9SS type A sorting domain-containing protein, partial [Chitinophagales bacterium]